MEWLARAQAARAAWPEVELAADEFVAALERAAPDTLHDADLFLAHACAQKAPGALAAFERVILSQVPTVIRHLRMSATFVDEVQQLLRLKLFVGPPPKITDYVGIGPLSAWLRVAALRTAISLKRTRGERPGPALNERRLADVAGESADLAFLKSEYRPLVREAFRESLLLIDSRARNLLRLHLVDGLTLEAIGRLFHVNRSTVFRWLGEAREALLDEARQRLRARLGVSAEEFDSLVQLVRSQLDLSLSQILSS